MNKKELLKQLEGYDDDTVVRLAVYNLHHGDLERLEGGFPELEGKSVHLIADNMQHPYQPTNLELEARVRELEQEKLRFYKADGTFEICKNAEEVIERRKKAAQELSLNKLTIDLLKGKINELKNLIKDVKDLRREEKTLVSKVITNLAKLAQESYDDGYYGLANTLQCEIESLAYFQSDDNNES